MQPFRALRAGSQGPPPSLGPVAIAPLTGTPNFDTAAGSHVFTGTPAVGDLIVIVAAATGATTVAVTDSQGGVYDTIVTGVKASSADQMRIFVRQTLITSAQAVSTTYTMTASGNSGGGIAVFAVKGMSAVGSAAVRGSGKSDNIAAGTTPAPVLSGGVPLNGNPILTAFFNGATTSVSQRAGYTKHWDQNYTTPSTLWTIATKQGGETSATITYGAAPGTGIHCEAAIELSAPTGVTVDATAAQFDDSTPQGTGAYATYIVQTDGTIRGDQSTGPFTFETWLKAGSAWNVEVMATLDSGDTPSGTLSTWLNCGSAQRSWQVTAPGAGSSKACQLTVQFRNASTLAVLDTVVINLSSFQDAG